VTFRTSSPTVGAVGEDQREREAEPLFPSYKKDDIFKRLFP
jgi:hypothetical protein